MKKTILKLALFTICIGWTGSKVWADELEQHYLVGGCTDSGWNTGENTRSTVAMMQVSNDVWVWCGKLTTGEGDNGRFKIPNGADNWNGYWAPAQGTVLTSDWSDLSTSSDGDNKYCVSEEGYYKVTINTNTLKIKAEKLSEPTTKDGDYYLIGSVADYYWFASAVISGQQSLKARLTTDLDFSTEGFFPLGNDKDVDGNRTHNFKGEFDGQSYTMRGIYIEGSYNKLAPFRSIDGATIKNLRIEGQIKTENYQMGGLVGISRGSSTIQNVFVATNMTSSHYGDGTHGGVIAVAHNVPRVVNVAFVGSINASNDSGSCGMIGYAHSGGEIYYRNCFVGGTLTLTGDNNRVFGRNGEYCVNCYTTITNMTKLNNADRFNGAEVTASQVASGELAYKLNGNSSENVDWYQVIGTDDYPIPFGTAVVYANGELYCDGTSKGGNLIYSNTNESVRDNHSFNNWGFCTNTHDGITCDQIQPDFVTLTDGFYQINDAKKLNWFAVWTDRKDASVKAKLTADIDMTEVANFPGIGSGEKNYTGEFDGQRHIISNMKMDWDREGVGLVNRAASGAKVKNVTIAANCSFKGSKAVAGIVGGAYGTGDIYIENCGNEGTVESTGQNAGGIVGVCFNDGGMIAHLTNVYNVGVITGATANESGSLSGWMTNAVLVNCYSIAGYPTSENTHGFQQGNQFARGDGIQLTNCYDYGTGDWGQNNGSWGSCFLTGEGKIEEVTETEMSRVFAALFAYNEGGVDGSVWRMDYSASTPHPVLYGNTIAMREDCNNRMVAGDYDVKLYRTIKKDGWNTFCVPFNMDATLIEKYFGSGTEVAQLKENAADDDVLHFEIVQSIEAGKAYLVYPGVSEGFTSKAIAGATIAATSPNAGTTQADFTFQGVFNPTQLTANEDRIVSGGNSGNSIVKTSGGTLKGFRAYFHPESTTARATSFVIDDGTATGIITAEGEVLEDGPVYNLNGQRVGQAARGIYIMNGKKVVMK